MEGIVLLKLINQLLWMSTWIVGGVALMRHQKVLWYLSTYLPALKISQESSKEHFNPARVLFITLGNIVVVATVYSMIVTCVESVYVILGFNTIMPN